jgi:hypothetical protein
MCVHTHAAYIARERRENLLPLYAPPLNVPQFIEMKSKNCKNV